uniref:Ig-like domain-containing protein n=1 Tax=Buteo japonicus TaxID=224669 RepID=A0A8C0B1X0_9AVES
MLSPSSPLGSLLDLSGVQEIKGTWMRSTSLPCTYMPSEGFTQQTLIWSMERDYGTSTIFRRDDSGDHVLLSQFRDRVSVPKHSPGDASLLIENLEIPDSGHYTCQVIWRSKNNSLITKEVTTTVKVVKGKSSNKPIIRASEPGLTFPAGARASLTCVANGSLPISYRWFRSVPGGKALLLSSQAELAWDSLQPSDTGKYYCEAENRVGAGAVQQSDAVQLMVRDPLCRWDRNRPPHPRAAGLSCGYLGQSPPPGTAAEPVLEVPQPGKPGGCTASGEVTWGKKPSLGLRVSGSLKMQLPMATPPPPTPQGGPVGEMKRENPVETRRSPSKTKPKHSLAVV